MDDKVLGRKFTKKEVTTEINEGVDKNVGIDFVRIQVPEITKGFEKKEIRVSKMPKMNPSAEDSRSTGDNSFGMHEIEATNCVFIQDEKMEEPRNPPKSRKRRADGKIAETSLSSPERALSKLRARKSGLSFRNVELGDGDLERIVGKRLKVYWSGPRTWFSGCIKSFNNYSKLHRVLYDDGEEEDLDLKRENFVLEVMSSEGFSLCSISGSNYEMKWKNSDGGEVNEEMKTNYLCSMGDVEPLKQHSRMKRETTEKAAKNTRFKLNEEKATKEKAEHRAKDMEFEVHPENSKEQVTTGDVKFVNYGDDLIGEKKGQGVSMKLTSVGSSCVDHFDCQMDENLVKDDVPSKQKNKEKPPRKRKRGADGEIAEALLLSPENNLSNSKLRPRKPVPSFQKVEVNEMDFERIVGKRVKVYWSGSRRWFVGRIKSFDNEKKLHRILYDDGIKEDLDLKGERFELEVMSYEIIKPCSKLGLILKKEEMSLYDGEASEDMNQNGSIDMATVKRKQAAKGGRFQLLGRKYGEDKTEDMAQHEKREEVTNSTYWYIYDDYITKTIKKNGSLDVARVEEVKQTEMSMDAKEVDVQPENNEGQVTCGENTYWYMYAAEV